MIRFTPNDFARSFFNLTQPSFIDDGLTPLLENALGKEAYDRYMIAQDPLCGGKKSGKISIFLGGDVCEENFKNIGIVEVVEE